MTLDSYSIVLIFYFSWFSSKMDYEAMFGFILLKEGTL